MSSSSAVLSSVLPPEQEPVNMAESHIQRYKRLRYPEDAVLMDSRSSSSCSSPNEKASSKLRAYRLNIERPFNILNEQSPLEYGDYMKLWDEKDYPTTVGPVEYMPPRHLGGNEQIWRTLMQFSRIAPQYDRHHDYNVANADALQTKNATAVFDAYEETNSNKNTRVSHSNWRILTTDEIKAFQQIGEIDAQTGEYTFRAYDLSHVAKRRLKNLSLEDLRVVEEDVIHRADAKSSSSTSCAMEFVTALSAESNGSEDDRKITLTEDELADMTARLFRRSELSLREKAEKEARNAIEEKRKKEVERALKKKSKAAESPSSMAGISTSWKGSTSKRMFSSKKLIRSLSSISNKLVNELNRTLSESTSRSDNGVCMNPKFRKNSSIQASAIEKARDLIDNENDVDMVVDIKNKKHLNLYIYGEYDILNDLVNDGAKRLSRSKHLSDLELLLQNGPCPPPNQWVRPTGWSRCNPSSCYAANPPDDYDLGSYGKNLVNLPKQEPTLLNSTITSSKKDESLSPKDSNATQSTAPVSGSNSEDVFNATQRQGGGDTPSYHILQVQTQPTESCGTPQGGYQPATNITTTAIPESIKTFSSNIKSKGKGGSAKNGKMKKSLGRRMTELFKI